MIHYTLTLTPTTRTPSTHTHTHPPPPTTTPTRTYTMDCRLPALPLHQFRSVGTVQRQIVFSRQRNGVEDSRNCFYFRSEILDRSEWLNLCVCPGTFTRGVLASELRACVRLGGRFVASVHSRSDAFAHRIRHDVAAFSPMRVCLCLYLSVFGGSSGIATSASSWCSLAVHCPMMASHSILK